MLHPSSPLDGLPHDSLSLSLSFWSGFTSRGTSYWRSSFGVSGALGIVTRLHLLKKTKTDKSFIGSEINDWILWMNWITLWWCWGTVNTVLLSGGLMVVWKGAVLAVVLSMVSLSTSDSPLLHTQKSTAFGYIENLWGRAELRTYPSPLSPAELTRWGFRGPWFVGWMPLAVFLSDWISWSQSPGIN